MPWQKFHTSLLISKIAYVTGVLIKDDIYTEVDSIEITDYIWVEPVENYFENAISSNHELDKSMVSDFFCVSDDMFGKDFTELSVSKGETAETKGTLHYCMRIF